ncbi:MAG: hypothetical protein C4305_07645, partial [Thermoleophilia bacterium]
AAGGRCLGRGTPSRSVRAHRRGHPGRGGGGNSPNERRHAGRSYQPRLASARPRFRGHGPGPAPAGPRLAVSGRAVYAASAVGSFLDTVLPARLGEASKVAVLRVSAGASWPGLPRAAGSLVCAHLVEAIAFLTVGAAAALFLPLPSWAAWTMAGGLGLAAGGLATA